MHRRRRLRLNLFFSPIFTWPAAIAAATVARIRAAGSQRRPSVKVQHGSCRGGYISLLCTAPSLASLAASSGEKRELCISIAILWLAELGDGIIAPAAAAEVIYAGASNGPAQAETNWISSIALELHWREMIFLSGLVASR